MSDSEKRRVTRAALNPRGAVPTPYEAKALETLRELEQRDRDLRDARREAETLREEADAQRARAARAEAERDLMQRLAAEAVDGARARSRACSASCEKAAAELGAARVETEKVRDQLGVARVALDGANGAMARLSARVDDLERRRADVLSPLAELRWPDRGSPTKGDCQSPPAHTLGASGGP